MKQNNAILTSITEKLNALMNADKFIDIFTLLNNNYY